MSSGFIRDSKPAVQETSPSLVLFRVPIQERAHPQHARLPTTWCNAKLHHYLTNTTTYSSLPFQSMSLAQHASIYMHQARNTSRDVNGLDMDRYYRYCICSTFSIGFGFEHRLSRIQIRIRIALVTYTNSCVSNTEWTGCGSYWARMSIRISSKGDIYSYRTCCNTRTF